MLESTERGRERMKEGQKARVRFVLYRSKGNCDLFLYDSKRERKEERGREKARERERERESGRDRGSHTTKQTCEVDDFVRAFLQGRFETVL